MDSGYIAAHPRQFLAAGSMAKRTVRALWPAERRTARYNGGGSFFVVVADDVWLTVGLEVTVVVGVSMVVVVRDVVWGVRADAYSAGPFGQRREPPNGRNISVILSSPRCAIPAYSEQTGIGPTRTLAAWVGTGVGHARTGCGAPNRPHPQHLSLFAL